MINIKIYKLINILLSNEILNAYVSNFWNDVFKNIYTVESPKHLYLMCKVLFADSNLGYRTLSHLVKVNYTDKELFIQHLQERLGLFIDSYTTHPINSIQFSYIIRDGIITDDSRILFKNLSDKGVSTHIFNNKKLPISMNPEDYGKIIISNKVGDITRYIVTDNIRTYQIDISNDQMVNNVIILGIINFKWSDTKLIDGFKREIGKSTIYFLDGEIILQKQERSAKPFKQLVTEKKINNSFMTLDIESITNENGQIIPYLINVYDGKNHITSYSDSSLNQEKLFNDFINKLLILLKNKKTIIYAHNLSGFDGIFLLAHLIKNSNKLDIKPLVYNGKIISIEFITKDNKVILFKDSYLLLPISLRKLCSAFNIENKKGYFPFKLKDINYIGILPSNEYWNDITIENYKLLVEEYKDKVWNFKEEAIKYCQLDCISLYDLISSFNNLIFNEFNVNSNKCLTLPSLAMKIFKSKYMPKDSIYQLLGNIEKDIRSSYTGGAVDMYIPHNIFEAKDNINTDNLFYYDVNSLYPFVMNTMKMPIGKPIYFEGDILKIDQEAFGFFYCKITTPEYLDHPILQRKINTNEGLRTIAGLGSWEGYIFSEELKNAIKYGYKFEVIKGYQFSQRNIFSEYINKLYNLRLQYNNLHPMNLIAKLLMNSLYGKFGMKSEMSRVDIYDCSNDKGKKEFNDMLDFYGETINDYIKLENNFIIIRESIANLRYDEDNDFYHGIDVNIAIASAITSYSRMYMSLFKNNQSYKLYYSDTDSIVIDKELPKKIIGNKLGQLKLEYKIKKGIFLAPKVYALETYDGKEVIKVKGLTAEIQNQLSVDILEDLLYKDSSREFTQEKWFKQIIEGKITISDIIYTLKVTSNKREPVYNNNMLIDTKPIYLDKYNKLTPH